MTNRTELYHRFAARFHAGKRLRPASEDQVQAAESALGVVWPDSYRTFALTCGAVYCPSLLSLIAARKPGFFDVQQFLTPRQSITETRRCDLQPAGACLAFAHDCMGNLFYFRALPTSPPRPDDAAVWLFDHDDDRAVQEAASFDEWLGRLLSL